MLSTQSRRIRTLTFYAFAGSKGAPAANAVAQAAAQTATQRAADNVRRPAVIVIEGAESADPETLRDLILVLSEVSAAGFATQSVNECACLATRSMFQRSLGYWH